MGKVSILDFGGGKLEAEANYIRYFVMTLLKKLKAVKM